MRIRAGEAAEAAALTNLALRSKGHLPLLEVVLV